MSRILIAEDEERIASFLERGLRAHGHSSTIARTGDEALAAARDSDFDLLILDLGLPRPDGYEVLRAMRLRGDNMPVVILTARADSADTVRSLEAGADDYLTKPFRFDELLARVRARLRDTPSSEPFVMRSGDVSLDLRSRTAEVKGRVVALSAREFALLQTMIDHHGQVLTRDQLVTRVWGYDFEPGSNIVDVYVRYLRRKLGANVIVTVRGVGYRYTGDVTSREKEAKSKKKARLERNQSVPRIDP